MEIAEAEMVDFARAELTKAAQQMVSERTIAREACLPALRACNSPSGGRLFAKMLANLGVTPRPSN